MYQKLIALLLVVALLVSGCTVLQENNSIYDLPPIELSPEQTEEQEQLSYIYLYYFDETTGQLSMETQSLQENSGESRPTAILAAFVNRQRNIGLGYYSSRLELVNVMVTGDVANIYFSFENEITEKQRFYVSVAAANTAIDNFGVKYANVEINDTPLQINGVPCGLLSKSEGDISKLYAKCMENHTPENSAPQLNVELFFLDSTKQYALSEVHSVVLDAGTLQEQIEEVLRQLSLGAEYDEKKTSPVERYFSLKVDDLSAGVGEEDILSQESSVRMAYENKVLFFYNADSLFPPTENIEPCLACIYYSLTSLFPDISFMGFVIGGKIYYMDFDKAKVYLGNEITIYLPDENSSSLKAVSRVVKESLAFKWSTYIEEIMRGPIATDASNLVSPFPGDIEMDDFLGLTVNGSSATINFSKKFWDDLKALPAEKQSMLIYSIVNTMCDTALIKSVQFLIEGVRVGEAGKKLNLFSPFIPNIGLAS